MILCCGEALIDMIPAPTVSGAEGFVPHSGGSAFNTAIALGRLGAPVSLLAGVSTDLFGQRLLADLQASHVDISHVIRSDRPTTLAFVHLRDGSASYSFYDENSAGRMLEISDMPVPGAEISALFFGGISLACEPAADAFAALMARECQGRAVMLDLNIRPGFIADPDRFRARLDRLIACSDCVKVSQEDLDWMFPSDLPGEARIARLLEQGPGLVILTQGARGATGFSGDGLQRHVPARPVKVVDTIGAGDTFNAGFLARLHALGALSKAGLRSPEPAALNDALLYGSRAASVTVSRAGANPPRADEL